MQYLNCVPVVQHGQIYQVYIPQGLLVVQMLSRGNGLILKDGGLVIHEAVDVEGASGDQNKPQGGSKGKDVVK